VSGDFTVAGGGYGSPHTQYLYAYAETEGDTGQVVPYGLNPFYPGFMDSGWADRYHEPPAEMLDTVYRALRDPDRAGLVPVAVSPLATQVRTRKGPELRTQPALVFDWEGVHYVYRPYRGTIGHPIPLNPVTGLPYLCVKDGGLLESIYFSATYLRGHPAEKAVVVASDSPAAAYTVNGRLCLFSPALNQFVLVKSAASGGALHVPRARPGGPGADGGARAGPAGAVRASARPAARRHGRLADAPDLPRLPAGRNSRPPPERRHLVADVHLAGPALRVWGGPAAAPGHQRLGRAPPPPLGRRPGGGRSRWLPRVRLPVD
jgi:hypothetical protein